jgi:hypothetical protein
VRAFWRQAWQEYGKCTAAASAVDYLGLGLQLDQSYPLVSGQPRGEAGASLSQRQQQCLQASVVGVTRNALGWLG